MTLYLGHMHVLMWERHLIWINTLKLNKDIHIKLLLWLWCNAKSLEDLKLFFSEKSENRNAPLWRLNSSEHSLKIKLKVPLVLTSCFLLLPPPRCSAAHFPLVLWRASDAQSRHLMWISVFKILTVWISILSSAGICQHTFSFLLSLKWWLLLLFPAVLKSFGKHRGFVFFRRFQSLTFTALSCRSFGLIARLKTCLFIAVDLCVLVLHVCLILFLFHLHHILLPLPAEVSLMIPTASSSLCCCLTK